MVAGVEISIDRSATATKMAQKICALLPEIVPETGTGYSPAARRTLKSYEAQLLLSAAQRAA